MAVVSEEDHAELETEEGVLLGDKKNVRRERSPNTKQGFHLELHDIQHNPDTSTSGLQSTITSVADFCYM
jgi:hypothetical protein